MGLIDLASWASKCRGLDYFKDKNVSKFKRLSEDEIEGVVKWSGNNEYNVKINIAHPRSSVCNCQHAYGKRVVCKHMVAMFFKAFPIEAKNFEEFIIRQEEEYDEYMEKLDERLNSYINKMSKQELIATVKDLIEEVPEWVKSQFVEETIGWDV